MVVEEPNVFFLPVGYRKGEREYQSNVDNKTQIKRGWGDKGRGINIHMEKDKWDKRNR